MKVKFIVEGKEIEVQEELVNYFVNSKYLRSSLRRIPFSQENLETAKAFAKIIYKNRPLRVRWRGTRKHHPDHTIKSEATDFDVYVR